jgi:hypothetical protein
MNVLLVKEIIRLRDRLRCTHCGLDEQQHLQRYGRTLEVHRVEPGSAYALEGCVTVCQKCHGPLPRRPRGMRMREDGIASIRVPEVLYAQIQKLAERNYRTISGELRRVLEQALAAEGLWPPGEEGDEAETRKGKKS